MHSPLPKSYKGFYPFRLATTSFIYPDDYVPNVRMLGPYVDEVELLLFESAAGSLPSRATIRELARLGVEHRLTYNIHLPSDIDPGSDRRSQRKIAMDAILRVMELTEPLAPSTHTLHLPCHVAPAEEDDLSDWQEHCSQSLDGLQAAGCALQTMSVETLMYPFEWAAPLLERFDLGVCLDIGHLLLQDADLATVWNIYGPRTSVIHLHAVAGGRDHLSLENLTAGQLKAILAILNAFLGVVSLELFGYRHLAPSLAYLEKAWSAPAPAAPFEH